MYIKKIKTQNSQVPQGTSAECMQIEQELVYGGVRSCVWGQMVWSHSWEALHAVIKSVIFTDTAYVGPIVYRKRKFDRCQVPQRTSAERIQTTVDYSEQPCRNHITWLERPYHDGRAASNYTVDDVSPNL